MGQYLKAVGGYTVEQTGLLNMKQLYPLFIYIRVFSRLLSLRLDRVWYCFNTGMCDLDRLHTPEMAGINIHVRCMHIRGNMHPGVE